VRGGGERAATSAARASGAPPAPRSAAAAVTTCSQRSTLGHSTSAQCANHLQVGGGWCDVHPRL
jgi:hypothetical protein